MNGFEGLEIKTVSTVTAARRIRIRAAAVRAYRTLYGEICFIVEGQEMGGGWSPISREFSKADEALDEAESIQRRIAQARKEGTTHEP